jgi:hypothetical protein
MLILLIDDMSRYMWLQLRQTKNDAVEAIKQVQAQAEAESGRWMCVSMDGRGGGGEFTSTTFKEYCNNLRL